MSPQPPGVSGSANQAPALTTSAAPSASSATTTTPSSPPLNLTIPLCEDLLPIAELRSTVDSEGLELLGDQDDAFFDSVLGPLAAEALSDAVKTETCRWAIPQTDGGFTVTTVQLPESVSSELVSALIDSDAYTASDRDGLSLFRRTITSGIGSFLGYSFDGPVWVIAHGTVVSDTTVIDVAADAAASVRTAND